MLGHNCGHFRLGQAGDIIDAMSAAGQGICGYGWHLGVHGDGDIQAVQNIRESGSEPLPFQLLAYGRRAGSGGDGSHIDDLRPLLLHGSGQGQGFLRTGYRSLIK